MENCNRILLPLGLLCSLVLVDTVMKSFLVGRCCVFECAIAICHEELSGRQVLHV